MLTGKLVTPGMDFTNIHFYKLPYIGIFSKITQKKASEITQNVLHFQNKTVVYCERFCATESPLARSV